MPTSSSSAPTAARTLDTAATEEPSFTVEAAAPSAQLQSPTPPSARGQDVAPLVILASLGLTTTLVHEKKHEGQHRGKNDRRASQDIKVVRGHENHSTDDGQHLPRPRPRSSATSEGPSKRSGPRRGFHQLAFMPNDPTSSPLSGPSHEALDRRRTKHASESLDGRAQVLHANSL